MSEAEMLAIFLLAGVAVEKAYKIENLYWPDHPDYAKVRAESPWWLAKTAKGLVRIGWRKRVIAIDWSDTGIECEVTKDDVTKDAGRVHAWGYAKAVEYLTNLGRAFERADRDASRAEPALAVDPSWSTPDVKTSLTITAP